MPLFTIISVLRFQTPLQFFPERDSGNFSLRSHNICLWTFFLNFYSRSLRTMPRGENANSDHKGPLLVRETW